MDRLKVKNKILEYYENVLKKGQQALTHNEEADRFIKEDPAAFLFAVILDQGARAERIWEIPYYLKRILGHFDVHKLASIKEEELLNAFEKLPSKPRYWRTALKRIKNVAVSLVNRYHGDAENIWNDNPRAGDLQARFDNFDGIGQKKASMATRILGMDLNVPIRNWEEIDVSVDEIIMRVFPRTGLSDSSNPRAI